ncbi:biopolymer transporter ExbD [Rhodobacteraceae bacterium WD3A24]|nr:biopolymer transporter ExbD [Rhodobacteraceae bacterium WD3A24]
MRLARPQRRGVRENTVPMINIVFLLLIFFLMTAQIAPPEPLDVTPPETADADAPPDPDTALFVDAGGALSYDGRRGEDALARIAARDAGAPLSIRADADLPGAELAALLRRLAGRGVARVSLITVAGG